MVVEKSKEVGARPTTVAQTVAFSLLAAIATGVVAMWVNMTITGPERRLNEIIAKYSVELEAMRNEYGKEINFLSDAFISQQEVLSSWGRNFDEVIPLKHSELRAELATVRGGLHTLSTEVLELAARDMRPNPFTSIDAERLEKRIDKRHEDLQEDLDKWIEKLEKFMDACVANSLDRRAETAQASAIPLTKGGR